MDDRMRVVERFCYSLSPEQRDDLRSILNITISDSLISCLGDAKIVSDIELQKNKNYDEGYSVGYDCGFSDGKSEGYEEGKSDGYKEGYGYGYDEGLEEGKGIS